MLPLIVGQLMGKVREKESHDVQSILKHDSSKSPETKVKGILKSDNDEKDNEPRSILKQRKAMQQKAYLIGQELKGILKQEDSERGTMRPSDVEPRGILKQQETGDEDEEPKGILKHKELSENRSNTEGKIKSALRNEGSFESQEDEDPRGILKKENLFESRKCEPEENVLKKSVPPTQDDDEIIKTTDPDGDEKMAQTVETVPTFVEIEQHEISATPERRRDRKGER